MAHREQLSQLRHEYSDNLKELGSATRIIFDAIVQQQDVFHAAHEAQLEFLKIQRENAITNIDDIHQEIISARQNIILAVRVIFVPLANTCTHSLLATTARHCRTGTVVGQTT